MELGSGGEERAATRVPVGQRCPGLQLCEFRRLRRASPFGAVNRVGSESPKGDGLYGQADLAGNVLEWVQDWYVSPYTTPCSNCAYMTGLGAGFVYPFSSPRVLRGGSFGDGASDLLSSGRGGFAPTFHDPDVGARCARSAP